MWPAGKAKSTIRQVIILADYHQVWLSVRDEVICFYLKIPEMFMSLILQHWFCVLHISLVRWSFFVVSKFETPTALLNMWLNGIISNMNNTGEISFPWNISLRIFSYVKMFPPSVKSNFFVMIFMTWLNVLNILRQFIVMLCETIW